MDSSSLHEEIWDRSYRLTLPAQQQQFHSSTSDYQHRTSCEPHRYTQSPLISTLDYVGPLDIQQERVAWQTANSASTYSYRNGTGHQRERQHVPRSLVLAEGHSSHKRVERASEKESTVYDWGVEYGFVRREPYSPNVASRNDKETFSNTTTSSSSCVQMSHDDERFGRIAPSSATDGYLPHNQPSTQTRVADWGSEQIPTSLPPSSHPHIKVPTNAYQLDVHAPIRTLRASTASKVPHIPAGYTSSSSDKFANHHTFHDSVPPSLNFSPSSSSVPLSRPPPVLTTTPTEKGVPVQDLPHGVIASRPSLYRKPIAVGLANPAKRKTGILAFRKRTDRSKDELQASIGNAIEALNNPVP